MDKALKERLERIQEEVRNLPPPTEKLVRRTYALEKTRSKKAYYLSEKLYEEFQCQAFP